MEEMGKIVPGRFVEVPAPVRAPVQQFADALGLVDGLQARMARHGQWRCACCRKMQPNNSWMVFVPDGVMRGDPTWSVTEAARLSAYNGGSSGWCLPCAPKKAGAPASAAKRPWWKFWGAKP